MLEVSGVLERHAPETGRVLAGEVFGSTLARFHVVAYAAGGALETVVADKTGVFFAEPLPALSPTLPCVFHPPRRSC